MSATRILVTGAAGFIGFHLCKRLLALGQQVTGLDNMNEYYDVSLKEARQRQLEEISGFDFVRMDLAERDGVEKLIRDGEFEYVVNLAAQAGVRYSLTNPHAYIESNIVGFLNVLEGCRHANKIKHLIYASSSSVYGLNTQECFSIDHNVDHPASLYAASKKSNELMAHCYSHLYGLPTTGLRFFTVYGPWGRPDMAMFLFTKNILAGKPIDVFNHGRMQRDFTYIDDIIEGVQRVIFTIPRADAARAAGEGPMATASPYALFNIGNHRPVELMHLISVLEKALGRSADINFEEMQPGDVVRTCADVDALMQYVGFAPDTPIERGVAEFVKWYREYYQV